MSHVTLAQKSTSARAVVIDELTISVAAAVQRELRDALATNTDKLIIDLGKVVAIDSAGIGLLIAAKNSVAAHQGQIRLIDVPAPVFNLLKSMRLVDILNAEAANAEAASNDSEEDLERYFDEAMAA